MLTRDSKCSGPKRSNQQPRLQPPELQRVRVHPSTQRGSRLQIALHLCTQLLRNRIIDLLLHRLLVVGNGPRLRLSGKHARLRAFLDLLFTTVEEFVCDRRHICPAQVYCSTRADAISLVGAPERNPVHTVRPSDEQGPTRKLLQEHHTSATKSASQEDKNGAWRDPFLQLARGVLLSLRLLGLITEALENLLCLSALSHR